MKKLELMSSKPSVLIIGAGMYTCGRGTDGVGTVLPTLAAAQLQGKISEIFVAATSPKGIEFLQKKLREINRLLGTEAQIRGYPISEQQNPKAYLQALKEIQRPACAIVVVPDALHAEVAKNCLEEGLSTLVVKPLTPTLEEAKHLVRLANAKGLYGAVEFHKRFDEANLLLRKVFEEGRLGNLRYITVEFSQRRTIRQIFGVYARETNIFQYLGIHYVDLIHFVTRAFPIRVMAVGQPSQDDPDVWDSIQTVIEWRMDNCQFSSIITTNWIDPSKTSAMSDQKITFVGTRGRYQSDQKRRGVELITEEKGIEEINPYFSQIYRGGNGQMQVAGYGPESIRQFLTDITDIQEGRIHPQKLEGNRPTFREALVSTAVLEGVAESLKQEGAWQGISDSSLRMTI